MHSALTAFEYAIGTLAGIGGIVFLIYLGARAISLAIYQSRKQIQSKLEKKQWR